MSGGVSQRVRRAANRAQGLCGCGRERESGLRMCSGCKRARVDSFERIAASHQTMALVLRKLHALPELRCAMRRIWNDDIGEHVARATPARGIACLVANIVEVATWHALMTGRLL